MRFLVVEKTVSGTMINAQCYVHVVEAFTAQGAFEIAAKAIRQRGPDQGTGALLLDEGVDLLAYETQQGVHTTAQDKVTFGQRDPA